MGIEATKNGSGQSMAIWVRRNGDNTTEKAELHFNLWHFEMPRFLLWNIKNPFRSQSTFLDIGILLSDFEHIDQLCIYVPTHQNFSRTKDVTDLASTLNDTNTVVGIFNEPYSCEDDGNGSVHLNYTDENGDRALFARIWKLNEGEWTVEKAIDAEGSTITIESQALERARKDLSREAKIYFRLRIALANKDSIPFVTTLKPGDIHLLSGFERLECVDFRLNETRNLPLSISRLMSDNGKGLLEISEIHFLLATDVRADYVSGHKQFHKCRMLESNLWEKYAAVTLPDQLVIYHWKVTQNGEAPKPIRDFNAFLKFRIRESNLISIIRFVFFAALIGAVGSYVSTYFPSFADDSMAVQDESNASGLDNRQSNQVDKM